MAEQITFLGNGENEFIWLKIPQCAKSELEQLFAELLSKLIKEGEEDE